MTRKISLTVNACQTSHEVEPRLLQHYLRMCWASREPISVVIPASAERAR
jgi:hypothetical protein